MGTPEPRIVSAVGIAVSSRGGRARAKLIEAAMAKAVTDTIAQAAAEGKPFPSDDVLRAAHARARVQSAFPAESVS